MLYHLWFFSLLNDSYLGKRTWALSFTLIVQNPLPLLTYVILNYNLICDLIISLTFIIIISLRVIIIREEVIVKFIRIISN